MVQLARAKADEVAGFPLETSGAAPSILPIRSQADSNMQQERSYGIRDPDKYSEEGQRELERLQECQRAFKGKPVTYQEDLTRVWDAQGYFKGRPDNVWANAAAAGAASLVKHMAGDPRQ